MLYVAANARAVSVAIVVERKEAGKEHPVQRPVYYVSEVLIESKQRYPHWQNTTGNSYFAVCPGGRQRLERRTAKTFAVSRGRQKAPAKKATVNSCFAVCFLAADGKGSLPSAADGKEGGRQ